VGWALALSATFSFSLAPSVARFAILDGMDPTTLLLVRFIIAVALFAITAAITAPHCLRLSRHGAFFIGTAGALNGTAMLCFFWALTRLDASIASMMLSILPLVVLLLLALRGEKFTRRNAVRVSLALGGVYLLIGPGGEVDITGVGLMLVAVLLFAVQLVIIQWYLRGYDTRTVALYLAIAMMVVIGGLWLFQGAEWHNPGRRGWIAILVLAVISTFQARMLFYAAIRHLGSGQIVLLIPVELRLNVTWSVLFLQERLTFVQWLGGVLILMSALLAIRRLGRARWRPRWRFVNRV
jgi:drug/metabolite transporter (DMT)-like permease